MLDLDAHRADVELWVEASGPSDLRRLLWQWIFRASCLRLPLARAYLLSQLGYHLAQFIGGGKIGGALVVFGLQLGAQVIVVDLEPLPCLDEINVAERHRADNLPFLI